MRLSSWFFRGQTVMLIALAGCNHCDRGYRNGYYPAPAAPVYPSGASTYASGPPAYSDGSGTTFVPEATSMPQSPPPAAGSGSRTAPMFQGSGSR